MTKGEEQIAAARTTTANLAEALDAADPTLAGRFAALTQVLDSLSSHFVVKSALGVPFTAAVRRAAEAAQAAFDQKGAAGAGATVDALESAVTKLQGKASGGGGVVIT